MQNLSALRPVVSKLQKIPYILHINQEYMLEFFQNYFPKAKRLSDYIQVSAFKNSYFRLS